MFKISPTKQNKVFISQHGKQVNKNKQKQNRTEDELKLQNNSFWIIYQNLTAEPSSWKLGRRRNGVIIQPCSALFGKKCIKSSSHASPIYRLMLLVWLGVCFLFPYSLDFVSLVWSLIGYRWSRGGAKAEVWKSNKKFGLKVSSEWIFFEYLKQAILLLI